MTPNQPPSTNRRYAGLASYFEGPAAGLVPTRRGFEPDTRYETPWTPRPNVSAAFDATGKPIQTSDWWTWMQVRSVDGDGKDGWRGSNNTQNVLSVNPLALGLRVPQAPPGRETELQLALGTTTVPQGVWDSHFKLGWSAGDGALANNTTIAYYRTANPTSSGAKLDVQIGVFDPAAAVPPARTDEGATRPAQRAITAKGLVVDDYSDWSASFRWTGAQHDGTPLSLAVTGLLGSPFVYFTRSQAGSVELYFGLQKPAVDTSKPQTFATTSLAPRVVTNDAATGVLVVAVPQLDAQNLPGVTNYYAFFGPAGAVWTAQTGVSGDGSLKDFLVRVESDLAGKTYFSAALLPQGAVTGQPGAEVVAPALLELFRSRAHAAPCDPPADGDAKIGCSQVIPGFDPTAGIVTCEYRVHTRLLEDPHGTNVNAPLFALLPHHVDSLDAGSLAALASTPEVAPGVPAVYLAARGEQRLLAPQMTTLGADVGVGYFRTTLVYRGGLLPVLPAGIADEPGVDLLLKYLEQIADAAPDAAVQDPGAPAGVGNMTSREGPYDGGKKLLRLANLLPMFEQVAPTSAYPAERLVQLRNRLLGQVKAQLARWFDATDYQFLLHDTVWDTMFGYPNENFMAVELNSDHHFHWGYFLKTAALVARYDPQFVSDAQYGPLLRMLAQDAAGWDRAAVRGQGFPYLRNFQPYLGHSFADGVGNAEEGNNQESSSEAMNFASGMILLGEAMAAVGAAGGAEMRDTGIYIFTTEEHAVGHYWFDVGQRNFPADFTNNYDATTLTRNVAALPAGATDTIRVQKRSLTANADPIRLPVVTPFIVAVDRELMLVRAVADGPPQTVKGHDVGTYEWTVVRGVEGTPTAAHWIGDYFTGDADFGKDGRDVRKRVAVKSPLFRGSTLAADVSADATRLAVHDASSFPAGVGFLVSVGDEVARVTARDAADPAQWTVARGQLGTATTNHAATAAVRLISPTRRTAAGKVQGSAVATVTFFGGDDAAAPSSYHVINFFPTNASTLYLGRYRNPDGSSFARANFDNMRWYETFMYADRPDLYGAAPRYLATNTGTPRGVPGQGGLYPGDYFNYQALSDPAGALAALKTYVLDLPFGQPNLMTGQDATTLLGFGGFDFGESVPFTHHFIAALAAVGEVDPDVYATGADAVAAYAVFRRPDTGVRTFVAYNADPAKPRTLTFRTAAQELLTLEVPPATQLQQTGADAATRVTLGPPQGLPDATTPANRFFLRADGTLAARPGHDEPPQVLADSRTGPDDRGGQVRGPDYFPAAPQDRFGTPTTFVLRGLTGAPLQGAGVDPTSPRTNFSLWLLNNLDHNAVGSYVDPNTGKTVGVPENGAQVVANVAYFATAADEQRGAPYRVEVWAGGPNFYDATGRLVPGFAQGLWTWQEYRATTWQGGVPGERDIWFANNPAVWKPGDPRYPVMKDGVVRLSVWTNIPNNAVVAPPGVPGPDWDQSRIGLRPGAEPNHFRSSYLEIPYENIAVTGSKD